MVLGKSVKLSCGAFERSLNDISLLLGDRSFILESPGAFGTSYAHINSFCLKLDEDDRKKLKTTCVSYLSIHKMETSKAVNISLAVFKWRKGNVVIDLVLFPGTNELFSSATALPPQSLRL